MSLSVFSPSNSLYFLSLSLFIFPFSFYVVLKSCSFLFTFSYLLTQFLHATYAASVQGSGTSTPARASSTGCVFCPVRVGTLSDASSLLSLFQSFARASHAENQTNILGALHKGSLCIASLPRLPKQCQWQLPKVKTRITPMCVPVFEAMFVPSFVLYLYCALRQWRRGNNTLITTLRVLDCLNSVQHLQPTCLEDRFLRQQRKKKKHC